MRNVIIPIDRSVVKAAGTRFPDLPTPEYFVWDYVKQKVCQQEGSDS